MTGLTRCSILDLPNDDVQPQRHSEEFPLQLEAMEQVCREWDAHGCPAVTHLPDLESYLEGNFRSQLDERDRVYLLGGLNSLETLGELLNEGACNALGEVGAAETECNAQSALRTIFSAKLQGLASYRESLAHPALAYGEGSAGTPAAP